MQDLIVGAGAVGQGIGTALLAANREVAFVARGEIRERLLEDGISRSGLFGEHHFGPDRFQVLGSLAECRQVPDTLLVAVKSTATMGIAHELASCSRLAQAPTPIVLFQNGIGNAESFAQLLPKSRIFNGLVITGFHRRRPTHVEITAHANAIQIGSLFRHDIGEIESLAAAIDAGGIPCQSTRDVGRDIWGKLLYNAALNPLGALLGVPYGVLASGTETRRIIEAVITEAFAVMRAEGAATHWESADIYREHFFTNLIPPTAAHESSMLQDIRAGRRTEIDALTGEIVQRGSARGVPTPVNAALFELIRALESSG